MPPAAPTWIPALGVLKPGMQTTVQDRGRPGHLREGVPAGGAFDWVAHTAANLRVGNPATAASLEVALHRLELEALAPVHVCMISRGSRAYWNGVPVEKGAVAALMAGDRFEIRPEARITGARSYLAVAGGIAVSPVLGSRSTYLPAAFGGFRGRSLRSGDVLHAYERSRARPAVRTTLLRAHADAELAQIAFIPIVGTGYHGTWLSRHSWTIHPQSNRMGLRLFTDEPGRKPPRRFTRPIVSQAVFPGAIQLPPDGSPVVLGADAQTVGGYPLLGAVIHADLWKLGQLAGGAPIQFVEVTLAEARERAEALERLLGARF